MAWTIDGSAAPRGDAKMAPVRPTPMTMPKAVERMADGYDSARKMKRLHQTMSVATPKSVKASTIAEGERRLR